MTCHNRIWCDTTTKSSLFFSLGFICCGEEYVNSSTSLCCVDNDGAATIHPSGNATVTLQCCGSKVIHLDEECCNGIGFDPQRHVCADQATAGLLIPVCFKFLVNSFSKQILFFYYRCALNSSKRFCSNGWFCLELACFADRNSKYLLFDFKQITYLCLHQLSAHQPR